jgi:branched-chain amino acid transport system substrate-binding protein
MSTQSIRRSIVKSATAAVAAGPFITKGVWAQSKEIVVAGAQPMTGVFSFAGIAMNNGIADFCKWKNANGGVAGHKLRYVSEDTGFKLDQGVAIFKKLMASEKPSFFLGDSTQWCKAVARDAIESGHVMTTSTSCAAVMADPVNMPHNFAAAPTYGSMHEILMEYIARTGKASSEKPKVALIYADTEFGRDGIAASKARAEKLGLPIVAEIVTKQSGVDVAPEVAKLRRAKPDVAIFQGYVVAPIPEFVKQMREAGMSTQVMGTIWSMDKMTYAALGAMGENWMGVMPYRYPHDEDSKTLKAMRDFNATNRPEIKDISIFYMNTWLCGMIFSDLAEKCIKANKPLNLANMKAALESMKEWDSGGVTGLLADLSRHQIPSGRLYRYDQASKRMEPASGWIKV